MCYLGILVVLLDQALLGSRWALVDLWALLHLFYQMDQWHQ